MKLLPYRLFILGAGFSQPAGLPLGRELLDDVRLRVRDVFQKTGWDGQQTLPLDGFEPLHALWLRFPDEERQKVVEIFARLLALAIHRQQTKENSNDDTSERQTAPPRAQSRPGRGLP
jgi:GAF domain-containing protein